MLAAILKKKLTKTISGQRGYCVPKTASKSGTVSEEKPDTQTHGHTRGHTDARRVSPKELRN